MEQNSTAMIEDDENTVDKLPYLIFKLENAMYAVNGETINSIFVLEQQVTRVPKTPTHIRGIINVRSEVVPLVDLRILLNLNSIEQDNIEFEAMIEARKLDHVNWVKELRDSVERGKTFHLLTNPHECAFGQWHDKKVATTDSGDLSHALRLVEEPHKLIHECAARVTECMSDKNDPNAIAKARAILAQAEDEYMPAISDALDKIIEAYKLSRRQMVVILQHEKIQIGVFVDEVIEVTDIDNICPLVASSVHHSEFVYGVGHTEQYKKDILMVDVEKIVHNSTTPELAIVV